MKSITRREALATMGAAAVATAATATGLRAAGLKATDPNASGMMANGKSTDTSMKVLLINGSPRAKGNTFRMLSEVAGQLETNGISSEIVQIGVKPVRGCTACGKCRANGGRCVFDDDICNGIIDKMAEADALIVGSPVYYGQPAGPVLSLIQRMAYAGGATMNGKPAAAVTVCRRGGATAAFQTLQMPFQMLNMPIVTSQYWNIGYGASEGQVEQDAEGLQTMRTLADNMAWLLKQLASGTAERPSRERGVFTNFIK